MKKMFLWLKNNIYWLVLFGFMVCVLAVTIRINVFRFVNFDFGKFDLGNMAQMAWYTLEGKPMWLTDYFGTNLPRWAMSHVDPILLLFVPIFAVFPHSLTLVFIQVVLVLFSALLIYLIANLALESKLAGMLFGFTFLFYPAVGFLIAWTGYHGVTVVIPFFLAAFYIFERMYKNGSYSKKGLMWFWFFLVLTMMGKEQLPLYIMMYGLFIMLFRFVQPVDFPQSRNEIKKWVRNLWLYQNIRIGLSMVIVGFAWFFIAFFVIIPAYAPLRVEGFQEFAESLDINTAVVTDVQNENYFLSRYEAFGDSYAAVFFGMIKNPELLVTVIFGGDKLENMKQTFEPLGYTPLLFPPLFVLALPDLLINYSTSADGIGTAEITNHRISMIVPVLFLASIYAVKWLSSWSYILMQKILTKVKVKKQPKGIVKLLFKITAPWFAVLFSVIILTFSISTSFSYGNPVYMWLTQAIQKRLSVLPVFAKSNTELAGMELAIGDRFTLSKLETKDRECAQIVVEMIPDSASVSGPDYLGAHLPLRETYAIFPALSHEADYVIVDVFAQKILRILELDLTLVRDVVADMIKSEDYELSLGCGNLFVFKKVGPHNKTQLLPLQERYNFAEKTNLEIFQSLTVVDYTLPAEITRGTAVDAQLVYTKRDEARLDDYVLFLTFVHTKTGEIYQVANLPSYSLNQPKNWNEDRYYIEDLKIALPEFLDPGTYKSFIGMSNEIRTRSIYLGDIEVK